MCDHVDHTSYSNYIDYGNYINYNLKILTIYIKIFFSDRF